MPLNTTYTNATPSSFLPTDESHGHSIKGRFSEVQNEAETPSRQNLSVCEKIIAATGVLACAVFAYKGLQYIAPEWRMSHEEAFVAKKFTEACSGKDALSCRSNVEKAFDEIYKKPHLKASLYHHVEGCIGIKDKGCKAAVDMALEKYTEYKYAPVEPVNDFIKACFAKKEAALLGGALDRLIEKKHPSAMFLVNQCIGKKDWFCQDLIEDAFDKFLKSSKRVHVFDAMRVATGCLGKHDDACKAVVKIAYPKLLEKNANAAYVFKAMSEKQD